MTVRLEDTHVGLIENGVPVHEQVMGLSNVFWVFLTTNLCLATLLLGVFVSGIGLGPAASFALIVTGNLIGSVPAALTAIMGPKLRLSQLEASRLSFGTGGKRVPAILSWMVCIGWDAINNIPSVLALVALFAWYGLQTRYWYMLAAMVVVQMFIGIYGHHLVQAIQKYLGYALVVIFGVVTVQILLRHGLSSTVKPVALKDIIGGVAVIIVLNAGGAAYSSDYTRYLPAGTRPSSIFWRFFLGMFLSATLMETLGYLMGSSIADQAPQAVIAEIQAYAGRFAPLALLLIAITAIPSNALNDNSASYCMISAGVRIARPLSAALGAVCSYFLAIAGANDFMTVLSNYLMLIFYWVAPWTAIVLVHWFMVGRHETEHRYAPGWTMAATIFVVVTIGTIALFSASPLYTSPVGAALGGIDIGYYVGFLVAGLWYWAVLKYAKKDAQETAPEIIPA